MDNGNSGYAVLKGLTDLCMHYGTELFLWKHIQIIPIPSIALKHLRNPNNENKRVRKYLCVLWSG